jgi:6-phosphogluconolactonase
MAYNTLISKVPISESNVYRIITENYPPELIAYSYEKKIKDFFKSIGSKKDKPPPGFDLTLLGIGKDGHTASIFPGCEALKETERWVVPVMAPEGYETRSRITLTLSVINNSQNVLFLVSGREKQAILRDIIDNREKAVKLYPAARVNARSKLYWFVEE